MNWQRLKDLLCGKPPVTEIAKKVLTLKKKAEQKRKKP
jgi:hypothetical protein